MARETEGSNPSPSAISEQNRERRRAADFTPEAAARVLILKALEAAAKRGVPVRIVLAVPDNVWLAGSNDETQFPGTPGLI